MFFQVAPMDSHQGNWRLHLLFHDVIAEGVSRLEMSCGYPNPCEQRRGMYLVAFLSNEICCWSCFNNIKAMALFNTIDGHARSFDSIMPLALPADLSVMFFFELTERWTRWTTFRPVFWMAWLLMVWNNEKVNLQSITLGVAEGWTFSFLAYVSWWLMADGSGRKWRR